MIKSETFEKARTNPYIRLNIEGEYDDFDEFYKINKFTIYKNLVKLFDGLTRTKKDCLGLIVKAEINFIVVKTDFVYAKSEFDTLTDLLLPYFESIEEYEICGEIIKIFNKLK